MTSEFCDDWDHINDSETICFPWTLSESEIKKIPAVNQKIGRQEVSSDSKGESPIEEWRTTTDCLVDNQKIGWDQISRYRDAFGEGSQPSQNAARQTSLSRLTLRQDLAKPPHAYFSIDLDHGGMPVTNQKDSGRCWLFGTLNLLRFETRRRLKLQTFEFSESYSYFFHLLEQCNFFMEYIMETYLLPMDNRMLAQLLDEPIADAGDWGNAKNLIAKYGLVPKCIYPETFSSSNTDELVEALTDVLRTAACRLRNVCGDEGVDSARIWKDQVLLDVYRVLCIHLGSPPTVFDYSWRDDNGDFHELRNMTPLSFSDQFVGTKYQSYITFIQDPRNDYHRLYRVELSNPVMGEPDFLFLNVPSNELKLMSLEMLKNGDPVWFACNVDSECDNDLGLWDANLHDREGFYGVPNKRIFALSKKDRILCGYPMGTHVMLITGVHEEDGVPMRWRVENSWGEDYGDRGYYTMNDNWFDEFVFEIVAPPEYLSDASRKALSCDPINIPGWDPMITSRRSRKRLTR